MSPSFLLGRVDQLLALQFWAVEDTMLLIVTLEAKLMLLVSFKLMSSKSSNDDAEINSASD
jgi:hypothetical protein